MCMFTESWTLSFLIEFGFPSWGELQSFEKKLSNSLCCKYYRHKLAEVFSQRRKDKILPCKGNVPGSLVCFLWKILCKWRICISSAAPLLFNLNSIFLKIKVLFKLRIISNILCRFLFHCVIKHDFDIWKKLVFSQNYKLGNWFQFPKNDLTTNLTPKF